MTNRKNKQILKIDVSLEQSSLKKKKMIAKKEEIIQTIPTSDFNESFEQAQSSSSVY